MHLLLKNIDYFFRSFPMVLLLLHLKKNHLFMLLWALLFTIILADLGRIIGLPYLFLDPEYLNKVNAVSFLLMGLSIGLFTMAFHISSYILEGERFRFLARRRRPFYVFSLNNSLIPLLFLITYLIQAYKIQVASYGLSSENILSKGLGFIAGFAGIQFILFTYFRLTNTNVIRSAARDIDESLRRNLLYRFTVWRRRRDWIDHPVHVSFYLSDYFLPKPVRKSLQADAMEVYRVFTQHHLNALFIIFLFVISLFLMGYFASILYFSLPAGGSILLLLSILILMFGAFYYWLKGWALTAILGLFLLYNVGLGYGWFKSDYFVYGLNYQTEKADYSLSAIRESNTRDLHQADKEKTIDMLNHWAEKQTQWYGKEKKPKLVLACFSGGGQRAAAWSLRCLQYMDSTLKDRSIMDHTALITGASGGLIGASYYRELYYQSQSQDTLNPSGQYYYQNITKDLLNPVAFMAVTNDLFYRYHKITYHKRSYPKDRGTAFEEQLNRITGQVFDKPLKAYRPLEETARLPTLLLSPTIINDGRRLYISSMDISYMNSIYTESFRKLQGVEFRRLFKNQDADNLRFSSALRMAATFPYITPNVILPSEPVIEIMDAGVVDNFGVSDALKFLFTFRTWVDTATSGVLLIKIRDSGKEPDIDQEVKRTFYHKLINPIRTVYYNMFTSQDNFNDLRVESASEWLKVPLEEATFQYIGQPSPITGPPREKEKRAALSWHLTQKEKKGIYRTVYTKANLYALKKIVDYLEINKRKDSTSRAIP